MNSTRSMAFAGLLVALHLIILLLSRYVPGLDWVVLLVAPLLAAGFTLHAQEKYLFVFAIATLLLGAVIDLPGTLLLLVPVLATGIGYGLMAKARWGSISVVYALAALNIGLFFLSVGVVDLLYDMDILAALRLIFHLDGSSYNFIAPSLLLLYAFAQAFLMHFILRRELKKIRIRLVADALPPKAIFMLCYVALLGTFVQYGDASVNFFLTVLHLVLLVPIVWYGYNHTKYIPMLIVQSITFLVASLPLLTIAEDRMKILAVAAVFWPVLLLATTKRWSDLPVVHAKGAKS